MPWTRETVLAKLMELLQELTEDFDLDPDDAITPDAMLGEDLEFESTDVVELVVAIEHTFGRKRLPFQNLIARDGKYVDFSVSELADFLVEQLNTPQ